MQFDAEAIQLVENHIARIKSMLSEEESNYPQLDFLKQSYVVAFPQTLLTVATEDGKAIIFNGTFPQLFTEKIAEHIASQVTNGANESPIVMSYWEYLTKKLPSLEFAKGILSNDKEVIDSLKNLLSDKPNEG